MPIESRQAMKNLPAAGIEPSTYWFGASLRIPVDHPRPLGHRLNPCLDVTSKRAIPHFTAVVSS